MCGGRVELVRHAEVGLGADHEVGVADTAELGHVETLDLDLGRRPGSCMKRLATVKISHVMPHAQMKPTTTWITCATELAAVAVEQALDVAGDAVPADAVGAVGEEPDREHAPRAAHAVHRDRAARVVDARAWSKNPTL